MAFNQFCNYHQHYYHCLRLGRIYQRYQYIQNHSRTFDCRLRPKVGLVIQYVCAIRYRTSHTHRGVKDDGWSLCGD